jgi:hypothetical protein
MRIAIVGSRDFTDYEKVEQGERRRHSGEKICRKTQHSAERI